MKEFKPISIVAEIWTYLSPLSSHQIEVWGEIFPTAEHAYQASKFIPGEIRNQIKNAKSAYYSWEISQKHKNDKKLTDPSFDKDKVMEEIFRAKFEQHDDIRNILKLTGTRGIIKDIDEDYYWGTGADGTGQNKMGKLWMKLRKEYFDL